jgi:hypothetical protein
MTKRKNQHEIEMEVAFFRSKLQDELDQRLEISLKFDCYLIDGKIFMRCVICKELKERTTKNFHALHSGKNFKTSRAGYENLQNSPSNPCICCTSIRRFELRKNEDEFIYDLVKNYKQTGLTIEWFYETLTQQQGVGSISGQKLQVVPIEINSVGIHKYNNDKEHTPDNCFLESQELNVPQHEAIPCLFCAWRNLYNCILDLHINPETQDNSQHLEYVRSQYLVERKDIDKIVLRKNYTSRAQQLRNHHFPTILREAIHSHIECDRKLKRFQFPTNIRSSTFRTIVYNNSIKQLEKQLWKCAYTDINLTIENLWTRFSFERINDDLPHFTQTGELTNIVFICRLLNTPKKLSKEKIMDNFLHQNLIPLPEHIRVLINPQSSFNWVSPKLWTQREIDLLEFTSSNFTNDTLSCDYCFLKNQIK